MIAINDRYAIIVKHQDRLKEIEKIKQEIIRLARADKIADLRRAAQKLHEAESEAGAWLRGEI